ncbi:MAG: catechol 2,3-dioxygenase [Solirubrobacteraceae bacterium]|nr:catechol 2,3-dioxygenase [Solirubrobacteraceae bacterium]
MDAIPLAAGAGLDPGTRIGAVHLRVADLDRAVAFYSGPMGLDLHGGGEGTARLGAGAEDLLVLTEDPSAVAAPGGTGLFHTAFLVPSRLELGRSLERLARARVPLSGFSDHLVSEAIYLDDPEGNGIEIYRDRPRGEWPLKGGHIRMSTDPLDVEGVLSGALAARPTPARVAAGTVVGHVHLRVADAPSAEAFYRDLLGLDVMARYPGASFLAAGGYHHQLGVNHWGSAGAPAPAAGSRGLDHFELVVGDLEAVESRTGGEGRRRDGGLELSDPSGNRVLLLAGR